MPRRTRLSPPFTPEQQLRDLAAILARGLLRLRDRRLLSALDPAPTIPPESVPNPLEVPARPGLNVQCR